MAVEVFKTIFDSCLKFMMIEFNLFGYRMSLYAVLVFMLIGGLLMWWFYDVFS